jgi:Ran GTPase-activating protein (RanGAP) involved in mRNA processing and transport
VNDNDIGPAGAASLAELLGTSASLKVMRLRGNRISDEGAAALARAVAAGPPLQELDIGGNRVRRSCASCLTAILHASVFAIKGLVWYLSNTQQLPFSSTLQCSCCL